MDYLELEKLGLNKNESRVYLALLNKGQATAAELVKSMGIHRNIVYDNLERLIERGLVSYIIEGAKRKFIAEDPKAIVDFLENRKKSVEKEIENAKKIIPEINQILSNKKTFQSASLFRGIKGIKKILNDILSSKEFWIIGLSNASVEILGDTFWKNFNIKRKHNKIKEHLLINANFKNVVNLKPSTTSFQRTLPKELTQITEIMLFDDNKVAIIVYSYDPIAVLIEDKNIFLTFKQQFEFLRNLSK